MYQTLYNPISPRKRLEEERRRREDKDKRDREAAKGEQLYKITVLRIRIRSDPYHLAGSVTGNVDVDPGSAKN